MNYFLIQFGNYTTLVVKTNKDKTIETLAIELMRGSGLQSHGGSILNPRQFISVESIGSPDMRQKRVAKDLEKVLF